MPYHLLAQAIRESFESDDLEGARAFLESEHPADLADFLLEVDPQEAWHILDLLPLTKQAETFGYLPPDDQVKLARQTTRARMAAVVAEMNADERADLFNHLAPDQREAILPALAQAEREDIRRLASYAEGTAGAIMTSDYAALPPHLTAREALDKLRLEAPDKETIYRAYVIDDDRRLLGVVRLQDLILAEPDAKVASLMESKARAVHVNDDQEVVSRKIAKYDLLALPVVDGEGRLVGIVTHDDAFDVQEQEATEDFHKAGTVGRLVTSVRDASIGLLYRKRVQWLVLLVFANLATGAGIAVFEDTIAAHVVLVFFMPVLVASAGNAGSQAATLMVRALATGDVEAKDWAALLAREVVVALALGLTMAAAIAGIGLWRGGTEIALAVSLTMVAVVVIGSVIGMSMPFVLSFLRFDPATASAPLITSLADVVGVIIYFSIATAILVPHA